MPLDIQTPVVGQLLAREFGLVGRVRPKLDEIIIPVVNVADLAKGSGLPLRKVATAQWQQVAVVGEYFVAQMVVRPGTLVQLHKLLIRTDQTTSLVIHHGNALAVAPASLATYRYMDGRLLAPEFISPQTQVLYDTQAAALATYEERYYQVQNQLVTYTWDGVVVGADGPDTFGYLEIGCTAANCLVQATLFFEEFTKP